MKIADLRLQIADCRLKAAETLRLICNLQSAICNRAATRVLTAFLLVASIVPLTLVAQETTPASLDESRSAWRFRRPVTIAPAGSGKAPDFAALILSPEILAGARPDLRDVRLVGPDGREAADRKSVV